MRDDLDVVVVGAGPAGCATAGRLAAAGHRVLLLDRSEFPRDKACGDGLTAASVAHLVGLGLAGHLDRYRAVRGTRLTQDGAEHVRLRTDGGGRVVPRFELDALLAARAAEAGADVLHGARVTAPVVAGGRVAGVRLVHEGVTRTVTARHVVAADGATSVLVRALRPRAHGLTGVAVRAYADGVADDGDCFRIFAPLRPDGSDRRLAGYGWLFPLADGRVNVGVGLVRLRPGDHQINLRQVFVDFVAGLVAREPGLRGLTVRGELRGAPLPCDFDPAACLVDGMLAVGDAANLVDPVTGEGIDAALESGEIAADVLDEALTSGDVDRVGVYPERVEAAFGPRMRTARALVESHEFVWEVLGSTVSLDTPLVVAARAAVADYGRAPDAPRDGDVAGVPEWLAARGVAGSVRAARERLAQLVATELPLLGPAANALRDAATEQVRMGTLLASARTCGGIDDDDAVELAACVELAALACRAHREVLDAAGPEAAGARAANTLAVSVGDMALFRAYAIAARAGGDVVVRMSRACARVCHLHVRARVGGDARPGRVDRATEGVFFELAAGLGAAHAGAPGDVVAACEAAGWTLGLTWFDRASAALLGEPWSAARAGTLLRAG